jgi:putative aldouronate transport system substrate-binding protein
LLLLLALAMAAAAVSGCGQSQPPAGGGASEPQGAAEAGAGAQTEASASEAAGGASAATEAEAAGPAEGQSAGSGEASDAGAADRPTLEISFWETNDTYSFQPGNVDPYADYIMEKADVTIVGRPVTSNDYVQKVDLWAATDDLPDVFMYAGPEKNQIWPWQEQGLIRQIPDDLSQYPLLDKYLREDAIELYQQVQKDGSYWAIPRADFVVPKTYTQGYPYIRKSDYEAMGSPPLPETPDEWFEFCGLIKRTFPERIALSARYDHVVGLFGEIAPELVNSSWYYYADRGIWGHPFFAKHDQFAEINRFWKAGFIDRDVLTNMDHTIFREKFVTGESVVFIYSPFPGHMSNVMQPIWDKRNPDLAMGDALMMLMRPTDYEGNRYVAPLKYWSENYISSKTDDEQLAAVLRLYEFFLSDDGFEFRRYGLPGKDYAKSGDVIEITREKNSSGVFKPLAEIYPSGYFAKCWTTWDEEFPFEDPAIDPGIRAWGDQYMEAKKAFVPQPDDYSLMLTTISTEKKTELQIDPGYEDTLNLLSADDFESAWSAMMAKYESLGLWEMCEEVTLIGREMGFID